MKITLNAPVSLLRLRDEAERIGVSFPALLTADVIRYRTLARQAAPELDTWQWDALSHILSGIEAHGILAGSDDLPTAGRLAAEVEDWSSRLTDYDEIERTELLRRVVSGLTPLAVAGVLLRLRQQK